MSPGERVLLNFLVSKGAATERGCWHRQKNIALAIGVSLRTVQRYLRRLEDSKLVRIQHRQSTTNLYFADVDKRQASFDFQQVESRQIDRGIRQNGVSFYRTEVNTPKGSSAALSPEEIAHPRTQELLRDRGFQQRVRRADDPQRYEVAVIRAELRRVSDLVKKQEVVIPEQPRPLTEYEKEALKSEGFDDLEDFIREHERKRLALPANAAPCVAVNSAPHSSGDDYTQGVALADHVGVGAGARTQASLSSWAAMTIEQPSDAGSKHRWTVGNQSGTSAYPPKEIGHVPHLQRSRVLRRPTQRAIRRAVEVVRVPGRSGSSAHQSRAG